MGVSGKGFQALRAFQGKGFRVSGFQSFRVSGKGFQGFN